MVDALVLGTSVIRRESSNLSSGKTRRINMWQQLKTCPFCGGKIKPHNSENFRKYYAICQHDPECFMLNKSSNLSTTLIPLNKRYIKAWNARYQEVIMEAEERTYLVFIEFSSGSDSDTECKRMTGAEIRKEFGCGDLDQLGIAVVEGNLIKGFESVIDLKRL